MSNDRYRSVDNKPTKKAGRIKNYLEKGFMKKLFCILAITFVLVVFCSCNPDTPSSSVIPETSEEITSKYVYVSTTEETLDSVKYVVKTYADVNKDEPYFYIYYKYYYLDGKLRAVYFFDHTGNVNLDYAYTEFTEHMCFQETCSHRLTSYDENGKVSAISYVTSAERTDSSYDENGNVTAISYVTSAERTDSSYYPNGVLKDRTRYSGDGTIVEHVECYETGVYKRQLQYYGNGALRKETTYYENGQKETEATFESDGITPSDYYEYYETGVHKETILYSNGIISIWFKYSPEGKSSETTRYHEDGSISSYTLYDRDGKETESTRYNEDGSLSEYTLYGANGKIKYSISYSLNSGKVSSHYTDCYENQKYRLEYNMTDDAIDWFRFHFSSGYCQYYYEDGTLYEYDDRISFSGYDMDFISSGIIIDSSGNISYPERKKDFSKAKTSTALTEQEAREWIENHKLP